MAKETTENQTSTTKAMKCIACGMPTLMKYRKGEIEAAFCAGHMPREERQTQMQITILVRNYF